jgi:hypothetical protein
VAGNSHRGGYKGDHKELVEVVHFTHEWLKNDYSARDIVTNIQIDPQVLQRVAHACSQEEEALRAFAELLAHGD